MHWDRSALLFLNRCDIYLFLLFLRCREAGARATGVSAVATSDGMSRPPRAAAESDGQGLPPLFPSALTYHPPLNSRPSRRQRLNRCSPQELSRQPGRCTAINHRNGWTGVAPPRPPPLWAPQRREGEPDSFCLNNLQTLLMTREYRWLPFPRLFARVLWSAVQVGKKYNVKLCVIWCPTNRLRPFFLFSSFSPNVNGTRRSLQSGVDEFHDTEMHPLRFHTDYNSSTEFGHSCSHNPNY